MVASVSELIVPRTADAIVTEQLAVLDAEDFPVTSWQSGSAPRDLVKADATAMARLDANVANLAKAAFLDDAEGDWLTLLAASRFDNDRVLATYTEGYVRVACASGAGPHTISAAQLLITDGTRRLRSTNTASVTIASGSYQDIKVRAETAGDDYNSIAVGATLAIVSPALAGLSVTNPVYASGTWITLAGADDESDVSLRARCRARWGTLGRGANDAAYRYLARTGHAYEAQVTRAYVVWGAGDGTLTVYLAGPTGAVSGTVVTAVQAWIDANKPGTDNATVASVTAVPVTVSGTIYLPAAHDSTANRALATDALSAYFAGLDVGQDPDLGAIYHALYSAAGITDIDLTSPSGDTAVNNGQVATLVTSLTWTTT